MEQGINGETTASEGSYSRQFLEDEERRLRQMKTKEKKSRFEWTLRRLLQSERRRGRLKAIESYLKKGRNSTAEKEEFWRGREKSGREFSGKL